ncbi:MAG: hypothetical protein A2857_02435 [Candidatus Levybacteria bacterium RIFCSPHIGHO2_01_FULL_36_15]|nr:MAG: hypothetical protein A2857_02435 [Candidatus Levybacteria bacterium RIFCSPHIGHO2_01_FULL_36_15]OGH39257.1 MAG: hypothetical protein A2905_01785 [Candidatus Levybacteria bacterium RIFCSPLOWO2_01_FULL_36_10]
MSAENTLSIIRDVYPGTGISLLDERRGTVERKIRSMSRDYVENLRNILSGNIDVVITEKWCPEILMGQFVRRAYNVHEGEFDRKLCAFIDDAICGCYLTQHRLMRWICSGVVEDLKKQSLTETDEEVRGCIALTSRRIILFGEKKTNEALNYGIQSPELWSKKISPAWMNKLYGNLLDPKNPLQIDEFRRFVEHPPIILT